MTIIERDLRLGIEMGVKNDLFNLIPNFSSFSGVRKFNMGVSVSFLRPQYRYLTPKTVSTLSFCKLKRSPAHSTVAHPKTNKSFARFRTELDEVDVSSSTVVFGNVDINTAKRKEFKAWLNRKDPRFSGKT